MVNSKIMYEHFRQVNNALLDELNIRKNELEFSKSYLIGQLEVYKEYIRTETNAYYNRLINQTDKINLVTIKHPVIKTYAVLLIETNSMLQVIVDKLIPIKAKLTVTYEEYAFIIKSFNRRIGNRFMSGYVLNLGLGGILGVRNKKNKNIEYGHPRIDWGESIKKKQEIINNGKIPFESLKDDKGKITGDNGGEYYFVYHTKSFNTWLFWNKIRCLLKNRDFYSFKFTYGGNDGESAGLIVKLNRALAKDPTAYTRFKDFKEGLEGWAI